jgi:hypothetical protein
MGVSTIAALSPQAKGRIERAWRTFQDRLVSELRLAAATNLEQANQALARFLADYNRRFGKSAPQSGSAYRKLDRRLDLDYIFCLRYTRTVGNDHVIAALPGFAMQLPPLAGGRGYARKKVEVCQQPDGSFQVYLERRLLHSEPALPNAALSEHMRCASPNRRAKRSRYAFPVCRPHAPLIARYTWLRAERRIGLS